MGGAGTGVPPVELEDDPPLEDELDDVELLLDDEVLELELELPLVLPEEPKLLEPPVAPELVDDVLVDPPVAPELVELPVAPELVDDVLVEPPVAPELVEPDEVDPP